MKKYIKPSIQIVSLKSSEDIATSYKEIASSLVNGYISANSKTYAVTQYSLGSSVLTSND
ncbi:MAG: hypothetical protein IJQ50_01590 [Clostridia bacterium]|nr:hypothetical protein [Clostridia bacterium]